MIKKYLRYTRHLLLKLKFWKKDDIIHKALKERSKAIKVFRKNKGKLYLDEERLLLYLADNRKRGLIPTEDTIEEYSKKAGIKCSEVQKIIDYLKLLSFIEYDYTTFIGRGSLVFLTDRAGVYLKQHKNGL